MIKDYRSRVIGTYDFLRAALTEVNRDPERLRTIGREADAAHISGRQKLTIRTQLSIDFELTDETTPFD
jgi:hypothetical protein